MEHEKIVTRGLMRKENKVAFFFIILGIVLFIISLLVFEKVYDDDLGWGYIVRREASKVFFRYFFKLKYYYGYIIILGVISCVAGIVISVTTKNCVITVTNIAVHGKTRGKAVNIPLNQISAVRTCSFSGVSIAAIGGVHNFYGVINQREVIETLAALLTNPQRFGTPSENQVQLNDARKSDTEKLKQLKDLFDSGAITQAEFDAKKKQILGL